MTKTLMERSSIQVQRMTVLQAMSKMHYRTNQLSIDR